MNKYKFIILDPTDNDNELVVTYDADTLAEAMEKRFEQFGQTSWTYVTAAGDRI